ncbi:MAG: hypothetical protein F6J94_12495 [Moorea sp. SIO1F2]|nr:hypothetical protein [Moorena sp. SIO1F2]NEO00462.1 hypothetical protein [Moorena sp. SIO3I7]NEO94977.1 hypothetical protein [Moorena sp. SIO3G5]NET82709.1 hypothetical protein [Moorena sp. SIO1F2]
MAFRYSTSGATSVISRRVAEKHSTYSPSKNELHDVQEPIITAPLEVRRIIERVLQAEKDKLYMKTPRNINDDILKIVKEEVQ